MPDVAQTASDLDRCGVVLGFDFGLKRIGVAIGERAIGQARPLTAIVGESNEARFAAIGRLLAEWQPARFVVGLPLSSEGEEHELTERCRRFARQLAGRYGLPVDLVDERYSSCEAEACLGGRLARENKGRIDAEAAAIVLQDWFDHDATRCQ